MPLGTFPSYGHQSRNAALRRETAMINSAATHRHLKMIRLQREILLYNWIRHLLMLTSAKSEKGEVFLRNLTAKMHRIKPKLEAEERVYFRRLGRILVPLLHKTEILPRNTITTDDEMKAYAEVFAKELEAGVTFGVTVTHHPAYVPPPVQG